MKEEKRIEEDLIAPTLPLQEEDGVNKFVDRFLWGAIAKVFNLHPFIWYGTHATIS
jgi:hypothetical protein